MIWARESTLRFKVFILDISRFRICRSNLILGCLILRYWQYFFVFFLRNFSWENLVFWLKLELLSTSRSIIFEPSILCSCIDSMSSRVNSCERFSSTKLRLSAPLAYKLSPSIPASSFKPMNIRNIYIIPTSTFKTPYPMTYFGYLIENANRCRYR